LKAPESVSNPQSRWPPTPPSGEAPIFPLCGVHLFPGCVMPLHVFEPRYRCMVEDLLDGPGRLVMGTVPEEHCEELPGRPPIHQIAGLGEIGRHERLPDGRFLIWVVGLCRVRIREVESDALYRRVAYEPLEEEPAPQEQALELRRRLIEALAVRCADLGELPDDLPLSCLTDLLLQRLELPPSRLQLLYDEPAVALRAEGALREHAQR
jgi:Lon protease-like protein